jgi:ribosomal RNA-processing protein 9
MKDSFFLGNGKKRSKGKKQLKKRDESSDDEPADVDNLDLKHEEISSASEDELQETPAQKRLRLAKQYLSNLKEEADGNFMIK